MYVNMYACVCMYIYVYSVPNLPRCPRARPDISHRRADPGTVRASSHAPTAMLIIYIFSWVVLCSLFWIHSLEKMSCLEPKWLWFIWHHSFVWCLYIHNVCLYVCMSVYIPYSVPGVPRGPKAQPHCCRQWWSASWAATCFGHLRQNSYDMAKAFCPTIWFRHPYL